jgi:hypothetical protein
MQQKANTVTVQQSYDEHLHSQLIQSSFYFLEVFTL